MPLKIDDRPKQKGITEQRLRTMLRWEPRRMRLDSSSWDTVLHEPDDPDDAYWILLPFCETLRNAFRAMLRTPRLKSVKNDRCWARLSDDRPEVLDDIRGWHSTIGKYVAHRDCLALSFSLDFERANGDPENEQTQIGRLRSKAKVYSSGRRPIPSNLRAANALAQRMDQCLDDLTCYHSADVVVPVPSSTPGRTFHLPNFLAMRVAELRGLADGRKAVRTVRSRQSLKTTQVDQKIDALKGTVAVDPSMIEDKNVLLVDDLYQSGASMNYVGMKLWEAGAARIYGLACEKTCRNDHNPHAIRLREDE